jgi:hypothetical protein
MKRSAIVSSIFPVLGLSFAALAIAASVGCGATSDAGADDASSAEDAAELRRRKDAGTDATKSDAGTGTGTSAEAGSDASAPPPAPGGHWMPKPGTSWQWQLSGTGAIDTSFDVQMYDIDLYDNSAATIASLKAAGRKVVCYFDTAYEPGRPDSALLAPYKHNAVQGWPGQYWLDVRVPAVVAVMKARVALAQSKGCDGIEADDVDSRSNNPGTGITAAEQQAFIKTLAAEAHARGMAYALKSDIDDIPAVLNDVDFDINEECFKYNECSALTPFITAGKAVFDVEYTSGTLSTPSASICPQSNALDFDTLIKHLDLGAPRYSCR